ncbi:MAG: toll/interleukin-1 receptor domain-containing protein [Clostridia bacterium]|nr:toll/interleukin-1 receptor domain-containing protein [Clostridia bacterium]
MSFKDNGNFIFISYSHKDSQKVMPIIELLTRNDFQVWYDAGIEAGTEWPYYIEEQLKKSRVVLVFMTPNTIESKNCRNEINFALNLDKEILIVYLEETELLRGMNLQLNSTQSLHKNRHTSNESFVNELINARILQCCRNGVVDMVTADTSEGISPKSGATTRIANVCSIGSNDPNDLWPSGTYSRSINMSEFRVVFFHMQLIKPFGFSGSIPNSFRIYNSSNHLIYEDDSPMEIQADYERISMGFILKGLDGSFVPAGEYRFECSINNSPIFTYFFTVCDEPLRKKTFFQKIKGLFND